jgi:excinuclease UvrABC nuclease subunit
MNVDFLVPKPTKFEPFRRSQEKFVPDSSGCYALTTFKREILYIGLSNNIRRRMDQHLDNADKTRLTENGRAVFFYWIESDETNKIERTWMNIHLQHEGIIPILNKIYSPI